MNFKFLNLNEIRFLVSQLHHIDKQILLIKQFNTRIGNNVTTARKQYLGLYLRSVQYFLNLIHIKTKFYEE
jgi:hypothetical protein